MFLEVPISILTADKSWLIATSTIKAEGVIKTGKVNVYLSQDDEFSNLELMKTFNVADADFIYSLNAETDGEYYFINIFPELYRLTISTESWDVISPPAKVHGFRASRKSKVLTSFRNQGIFSKLFVSDDQGISWKQYKAPPYVIRDIYFDDVVKGSASRWDMGAFSSQIEVLEYKKDTDEWLSKYTSPLECRAIAKDRQGFPGYCVTTGGSILRYADGDWIVEFSSD